MIGSRRGLVFLPVLLVLATSCGSPPKPTARQHIGDAERAIAGAKALAEKSQYDKALSEYSRANEAIAKARAVAGSAELPQVGKLDEAARAGMVAAQKLKAKADEEARKLQEAAEKAKRWRSRVTVPDGVDYFDVFPAATIMAGRIRNLGASYENAKKTALGRLLTSSELAPFWKKLDTTLQDEQPDVSRNLELWPGRFKGQLAVGLWQLHFQDLARIRSAVIAEITDPAPETVLAEVLEEGGYVPNEGSIITHKDVDIVRISPGAPCLALVGRHLVVTGNPDSAKAIVDGFLAPGGFSGSPVYAQLKPLLAPKAELGVVFDFEAYQREVGKVMAELVGPDGAAAYQNMLTASGADLKVLAMTSACVGDAFEDRFVAVMGGEPKGFAAVAQAPPGAPPPLDAFALIPANAAAATTGYMNADELRGALMGYLSGMKKFTDVAFRAAVKPPPGAAQGGPPPGQGLPDFNAALKAFEDKTGLNVAALTGSLKGEVGFYLVLAPGLVTQAPDIGLFLTCADAEKAQAFSGAIAKAFNAYSEQPPVAEVKRPNRTTYQLNLAGLGLPIRPNFPYTPSWAAEGKRIFLASSPAALQKQLSYVETQTPGLLASPEFAKALGALSAEERKGQVLYLDMRNLLAAGALVGLPALQQRVDDADLKQLLEALPQPQVLFKDMPPLISGGTQRGGRAESVMRNPVLPTGLLFMTAIGASLFSPGVMRPPGPVQQAPGQF